MRIPATHASGLAGALCFFLSMVCVAAGEGDGPYVMRDAGGGFEAWSVAATPQGPRKQVVALVPNASFTVPAVGDLPPFIVRLRAAANIAPDSVTTRATVPLFVVADTHGEYEILVQMLMKHRVIDAQLRWSFSRGHLVVLGDVLDRGAHHLEILWLLYELEAEARRAGGGVDFVLGNHETMEMRGDQRYLNPKYRATAAILGIEQYSRLLAADTVLGQWLRSKPTVLKLNDLLCLHGGISPELVARGLGLSQINGAVRSALNDIPFTTNEERERAEFLFGATGPLWYRGYFPDEAGMTAATAEDIAGMRKFFGVNRILVGHTKVPTITPLFDGAVIAVQVYPRHEESGRVSFEALLIRAGKFYRALPDGGTQDVFAITSAPAR